MQEYSNQPNLQNKELQDKVKHAMAEIERGCVEFLVSFLPEGSPFVAVKSPIKNFILPP